MLMAKTYLTGGIQRIRIGDAVSRDIRLAFAVSEFRLLFCADDMKLFLPVKGYQDCIKVLSDMNKLCEWCEWCERNLLFLNVDKLKL
jgi:hypothetical protein